MSLRSQFGKPKLGGDQKKIFRLKGEDKEIYRIFPPMKSCAEAGRWAIYHAQHFGYKVENKDGKLTSRPFGCVQKKDRSGLITCECAECSLISEKKGLFEQREAELKAKGMPEDERKSILQPLSDWLKDHSTDGKWYIGVKSLTGEFGALAIPHKMKKELDAKIAKLQKEDGIDPFDFDTGVWFHFIRTGKAVSEMNFKVEVLEEEEVINGKKMKSTKLAPLSDADLEQALKEIPDLQTEVVRYIPAERIEMLVGSSGDPEEIERILNAGTSNERSAAKTEHKAPAQTEQKTETKAPANTETKAAPAQEEDEEAALLRKLEEAKARKAAAAAKAAAKPAPTTSKVASDDLSDEEFAKAYGDIR